MLIIDHNILQLFGHSLDLIVQLLISSLELHALLVVKCDFVLESEDNLLFVIKAILGV